MVSPRQPAVQLRARGGGALGGRVGGLHQTLKDRISDLWKQGEEGRKVAEQLMGLNQVVMGVQDHLDKVRDVVAIIDALEAAEIAAAHMAADISDMDAARSWGLNMAEVLSKGIGLSGIPGADLYSQAATGVVTAFLRLQGHYIERVDRASGLDRRGESPFRPIPR